MHIQTLQSLTPDQSIKLAEFKAVELLCAALKFISTNVPSDKAAENPIVMLSGIACGEFRSIRDKKNGNLFGIQVDVRGKSDQDVADIVDYMALLYRQKDGQFYPIEYHQMNKIICENEKILEIIEGAHFKGLVDNKNIEGWNPLLQAMKRGAVAAVNTARSNPFSNIVRDNYVGR
jgi:hypothetical protein